MPDSITLGPLLLPTQALLIVVATALALGVLGLHRDNEPAVRARAETRLFIALAAGVLGARVGWIVQHWPAYAESPWAVLAFRDGGYLPWAGALVCGAVVLVFAWRWGRAPLQEVATEAVIASVPSAERTTALEDAGAGAGARHGPSAATGKRRFRLLLAPAAAGLGVFLAGQLLLEAGAKHEPLPSFEVFDTKGAPIQLAAAVGRPMVINLWASWCAPCRREMPAFARVQAQRLDVDFVFLNIGESLQEIEAFTRTLSAPLSPILRDPQGRVPARLEVRGYPTTLVLDGQGRLLHRRSGELSEASLKALLPPAPGGAQQPSRPRAN